MGNQESEKETKRAQKRIAEDAERLVQEQQRKKAYLAREQEKEKASKVRETERAGKRATEDIEQAARDQARKKAMLASEKKIAEAQEARRLKAKKDTP